MVEILNLIFELINLIISCPQLTLHLRNIVAVVVTISVQRVVHPTNLHLVVLFLLFDLLPELQNFILLLIESFLVLAQLLLLLLQSLFVVLNILFESLILYFKLSLLGVVRNLLVFIILYGLLLLLVFTLQLLDVIFFTV